MNAVVHYLQPGYRKMQLDDVDSVMKIENAAYQFPWSKSIFKDCIEAGYHCYVAELEGQIIAYSVFITAVHECHLLNLCVNPALQGQGLGRQLLGFILELAKKDNVKCTFLEVRPSNKNAIELYESEGFNEVGVRQRYYPSTHGREDAVIYAKEM